MTTEPPTITIRHILALVDELANVTTPTPASMIARNGLITDLPIELRPSIGGNGKGSHGGGRIPIDATGLALWEDITARVQALPIDLGDEPATTGSFEQILNTWARDLVIADTDARPRRVRRQPRNTRMTRREAHSAAQRAEAAPPANM